MWKTSLFFALVILTAGIVSAGDIYIPANTPTTGSRNNWPFNPSFGPEWRYQMVFTAAKLGNKAFDITEIAFAPYQTGSLTSQDLEVRMSHTSVAASSTFATNLPNPQVVLATKSHVWQTTNQTWSTLGLTTPFSYNGVDSLTIEIRYRNGTLSGFSGTCYYDSNSHPRIYAHHTTAYTAATGSMDNHGLKIRITYSDVSITGSGSPSIGGAVTLHLVSRADAGLPYQVGSSLGTGPIPIDTRKLGLSLDDLLVITVQGALPQVFAGYAGTLDASGQGQAKINIPNIPAFIGIRLHSAFLTLKSGAPSNIASISPTFSFTITK